MLLIAFAFIPTIGAISETNVKMGKQQIIEGETSTASNDGSLADNLLIYCWPFSEIFYVIFLPHLYGLIEGRIHNNNEVGVTIERHVTLIGIKENRVLAEYDIDPHGELGAGWQSSYAYFLKEEWSGYLFGPFKFILDIHIPEDDSSITEEYYGFVFGFSVLIFNPWGKVIE